MLVRAGELVEKRGLAAVLVAGQGKGQRSSLWQGVFVVLVVVFSSLTQARVLVFVRLFGCMHERFRFGGFDFDAGRIGLAQRQGVSVDLQLHRIAQRREFGERDYAAGNHAHIEDMLAQRPFPADSGHPGRFANSQSI